MNELHVEQRTIKLTKKLQKAMDRYGVTLRDEPTDVTNRMTGETFTLPPTAMAAFETAINANFLAWVLQAESLVEGIEITNRFSDIADASNMELMDFGPFLHRDKGKVVAQAHEDYRAAAKAMHSIGLYRGLLD
jgi:hypothetical protein